MIHTAAYKHVVFSEENVWALIDNNINGTKKLLDACVAAGVKKFLFLSTDKAADPVSVMGLTKVLGERLVLSYRDELEVYVMRFGNIVGSSGSVHRIFERQKKLGLPITLTSKKCKRYFIEPSEAISLSLEALKDSPGVFTLDMGLPTSMLDIAERYSKEIEIIGLRPGEKLEETLVAKDESTTETNHPKIWRIHGVYG